jgi:hypothetical protein
MKKIFLLLLIIYTANTFSQSYGDTPEGKYDKMADLFNHKKDEEAKKIAEELLSGKYGEIDGYTKFFTLLSVGDYYYQKDDYQKATDFYQQFLDFDKNENPKKIENKKIYIAEAKGKLEELKPKLSLVSANNSNTAEVTDAAKDESNKTSDTKLVNGNIASDNSTIQADKKETNTDKTVIQADKKETNTDKTVTLTVSGTGKTLEEARLNALRSAIEQAFGAFISSKTEILNDNLVKDEIVSIANGNVQKYDVVSQVELPNVGYAITLSATVSIDRLTLFAESKGVVVEFKGGMFAANIKLQKLNEKSEVKTMYELFSIIHEKLQTSFDYVIETKNPLLNNDQINYNVPIKVSAICNQNYDLTLNYLIKVLSSISLNALQVDEYKAINKKTFKIKITYNNIDYLFNLRNNESFELLQIFHKSWLFYLGCFDVENGINTFHGPSGLQFTDRYQKWSQVFAPFLVLGYGEFTEYGREYFINGKRNYISIHSNESGIDLYFKMPSVATTAVTYEWLDFKTLNELEKITNYSVKSSGIISKFRNGGYIIYEKNGSGIIAYPFAFNYFNDWGIKNLPNRLGTGNKLFDGKLNTSKIAVISSENIGKKIQSLNLVGFNDWVIPSSDELSLIFSKIYLLGLGKPIAASYDKFCSSTENGSSSYPPYFGTVTATNLENYYETFMKTYETNKNINSKDEILLNLLNSEHQDEYKENKHTYFQPIRYFKSE